MALFVIADLHLSLGSSKPMDVFRGWENYVERLEKKWRAIVTEEDTVVIAGDISWGMSLPESREDFRWLHCLPGQKILMKGNHDYWWSTKTKIESFFQEEGFTSLHVLHNNSFLVEGKAICGSRGWLYNAEKDDDVKIVNREVGRLNASLDDAQKRFPEAEPIVFLHYPPVYGNMTCDGILQVLKERNIRRCYFGHIHGNQASKRAIKGEWEGIQMHLISCDYVGFLPVLIRP
jgi:predicted phosphohydrolase